MCDINHGKGGGGKPLEADIQSIDPNSRIAKFPLKFCSGRKFAVCNYVFFYSHKNIYLLLRN